MDTKRFALLGSMGVCVLCAIMWMGTGTAGAGQKIEAALASVNAPQFITPRMATLFAKRVGEKTNGGLTIKVIASGQLGGMKENIEAVMSGNLEFCQIINATLGSLYPNTMLFDLPFVFRDNEHMKLVVRGPIGQSILAEFSEKTGLRIIMAGLADGPRSVWNRRRPVKVPEDLKGMKLRVIEAPIMVDTFRALGAIPTPMPFTDIYMAAKQGVIDGAEMPPVGLIDLKAPEVAKYYSLTKHFATPSGIAVNAKWLRGLPKEYQQAIQESDEEARAWYDMTYEADNSAALVEIKRQGMEVNEVASTEAFRAMVKPVHDKYADRVGGMKMIQAVIDTK
jgi:TRAP-type transport system periplasmic protein